MQRTTSTLRSSFVLIAGLAVVISACTASNGSNGGIDVPGRGGANPLELAPLFTVETADGGTFSLDEHIANDGRPIFLNLWASWCFPCREEMPAIDAASKTHPDVAFIGVSVKDTRSEADAFLEEVGVTYIIGFDEGNQVDDQYRPLGLPASYIISSDGVIVERIFGQVTEESLAEAFKEHFG